MATKTPQIEDLSSTINVPMDQGAIPKTNRPRGQDRGNDGISPTVRSMVTESVDVVKANLDQSINKIIHEKMNIELAKVHESIAQLADAVRALNVRGNSRSDFNSTRQVNYQGINRFAFPPPSYNTNGNQNANNNDHWKIRIDKFGLEFRGDQGDKDQLSVEEFVFRLEHMQRQYQIPWEEVLRDFHLLVSGTVKQWYWALLQTTNITEWSTLRLALLTRYKKIRSNWEIMHELVERKQMPGESIDQYFHSISLLRAKLETPVAEGEMVRIVKRNLRENLARIV